MYFIYLLYLQVVDAASCNGYLSVFSPQQGTIQSQTSSTYNNGLNCKWLIGSPENMDTRVKISFTSFDVECAWDFVNIYDGFNSKSPVIARLTGNRNSSLGFNNTFVSTSQYFYITFTTDSYGNGPGFEFTYNIMSIFY
jgi:hypothetical protein